MKVGDKVKVAGCREGWTDMFRNCKGVLVEEDGSDAWMVLLDGRDKPTIFFPDELTVIEEGAQLMSDRLRKAKAIAALGEGWQVFRADEYPERPFYCAQWLAQLGQYKTSATYHETPIDALAAATTALGLSPDPDILSAEKGVLLTEEQQEWIRQALAEHIGMNGPIAYADEALGVLVRYERNHLRRGEGA